MVTTDYEYQCPKCGGDMIIEIKHKKIISCLKCDYQKTEYYSIIDRIKDAIGIL